MQQTWSGIGVPPLVTQPSPELTTASPEEFILEPEGLAVPPTPPLAEDDPWNFDTYDKNEAGDWSQPEASWCNTNSEWTAPSPPAKKSVTYVSFTSISVITTKHRFQYLA